MAAPDSPARQTQVHATCVRLEGAARPSGVLLRGPSGSGKSDLALRLIHAGGTLVADDRVDLRRDGNRILAAAPETLRGLLEVRGLGVIETPPAAETEVRLLADMAAPDTVKRLPDPMDEGLLGLALPVLRIAPFEASAPFKLIHALDHLATTGGLP